MSLSQLHYGPLGLCPLPSCSGPPGYPRCATRFYDDRGATEGGPRDAAGRNQQWGMLDWAATGTRSEPGACNAALRGYATIPAPCYPAAPAEDAEAAIELPFAVPCRAGGESWIGASACPISGAMC